MPVVLGMPWVAERAASTVQLVLGCAMVCLCWDVSPEWDGSCLGTDVRMQCVLPSPAQCCWPSLHEH